MFYVKIIVHTTSKMGSIESWLKYDLFDGGGNKVRRCSVFEEVNDEIYEKVVIRIWILTFPVGTDISCSN